MEYRLLGRSGLKVSAFSFGAMTFARTNKFAGMGDTHDAGATRQIDMCLDAGVNLFDTADVYSNGQSEEILGEALGDRRKKVLIATKCFGDVGQAGVNEVGASRRHIIEACEDSLRRLKTDWIDLYQIHNLDSLTPAEETVRALDDLITAGKVRYAGTSNHPGWRKMKALATADRLGLNRYVSQQIQYSLLYREAEDELLPLGIEEGVGAVVWGPLAAGYLSGKFKRGTNDPTRLTGERLHALDTDHARAIVDVLEEVAAGRPGATLSQVALNWVVRKAGVATILMGARTDAQLADNLAAATWSLSDEEIKRLDDASKTPIRYPYSHNLFYGRGRNARPGLLPPLPAA